MTEISPHVHVPTAIYLETFDFEMRTSEPTCELMVAATPRSGSTALCLEMWRTGILGSPLEYANFELLGRIPRWAGELGDKLKYWRKVKSVRTGENGVFSYKFFISNYKGIAESDPQLLERIAPNFVIYLTRRDLLSQAISYSKASRSGRWFGGGLNESPAVPFDVEHIKEKYLSIRRQMQWWERVFEMTHTSPIRVTYEDFLEDPQLVIRRSVALVLGDDVAIRAKAIPQLAIQRDSQTENWRTELSHYENEWSLLAL